MVEARGWVAALPGLPDLQLRGGRRRRQWSDTAAVEREREERENRSGKEREERKMVARVFF